MYKKAFLGLVSLSFLVGFSAQAHREAGCGTTWECKRVVYKDCSGYGTKRVCRNKAHLHRVRRIYNHGGHGRHNGGFGTTGVGFGVGTGGIGISTGFGKAGCANEVQEANASIAVKTLKALSKTTDFKDATKLKSVVGDLQKMTEASAQVNALLAVVKVNPEDSAAVYNFVYGRSVSQYVRDASTNLELDPKQTEIVLEALQSALKLNK